MKIFTTFFFAAIILFSHGVANSGELQLSRGETAALGQGFKPATGQLGATCVQTDASYVRSEELERSEIYIRHVDSYSSLAKSIQANASVSAKWGFGSGSASISWARSQKLESQNIHYLMSVTSRTLKRELSTVLLLDSPIQRALEVNGDFQRICGTEFVYSLTRGGRVLILLTIATSSDSEKRRILSEVGLSFVGGNGAASFQSKLSRLNKWSSVTFEQWRVGGTTDASEAEPSRITEYALSFSRQVEHKDDVIEAETRSYADFLPEIRHGDLDNNRLGVLESALTLKEKALDRQGKVNAAISAPWWYKEIDIDLLRAEAASLASLLQSLDDAAISCSRTSELNSCGLDGMKLPHETPLARHDKVYVLTKKMTSPFYKVFENGLRCRYHSSRGVYFTAPGHGRAKDCARLVVSINSEGTLARSNFDTHYEDNRGSCDIVFVCDYVSEGAKN